MTLRDLYKKHHWQVSGPTFYQLHLLFEQHFDKAEERRKPRPERSARERSRRRTSEKHSSFARGEIPRGFRFSFW